MPGDDPLKPDANLPESDAPEAQDPSAVTMLEDPAARSFSDALSVSFRILQFVMVAIVLVYLSTGYFWIDEQERGVKLRFGKIVGEPGQRVLGPGPKLSFPPPFEDKIIVHVGPQSVELTESFWYELSEQEKTMTADELAESGRRGPLNPTRDSYLLTGDANIVHGRFKVTYHIDNVERYVLNLNDTERAERLVVDAAERGIMQIASSVLADDFIAGRNQLAGARERANRFLAGPPAGLLPFDTGLVIDKIEVVKPAMPLAVRNAYNAVNNAESERAKAIDDALRERATTLSRAGGPASSPVGRREGPLTELMNRYEATPRNDPEYEALASRLDQAFRSLSLTNDEGNSVEIGGEAAKIIDQARSNRFNITEGIKREADRIGRLTASYREDPALFRHRYWQEARAEIFSEDVDYEVFYAMPNAELYYELNRDPQLERDRENREFEQRQRQAEEQSR